MIIVIVIINVLVLMTFGLLFTAVLVVVDDDDDDDDLMGFAVSKLNWSEYLWIWLSISVFESLRQAGPWDFSALPNEDRLQHTAHLLLKVLHTIELSQSTKERSILSTNT